MALDDSQLTRLSDVKVGADDVPLYQLTYNAGKALLFASHGDKLVVLSNPAKLYDPENGAEEEPGSVSIKAGSHKIQNSILNGTTTDVKEVVDLEFIAGRLWTESEEERAANVAILGHDAAEDLFPDSSPIGQDVDVEGHIMTVIGVLDVQPQPFGSGEAWMAV